MIFNWFDASEAASFGVDLADQLTSLRGSHPTLSDAAILKVFSKADRDVRVSSLNFYKKAKFANSFKWRLLENGIGREVADDVTQRLVMHLSSTASPTVAAASSLAIEETARPSRKSAKHLLALGNSAIAKGDHENAIAHLEELLRIAPANVLALNNLGAVLNKLGRYNEAEACFQEAIRLKPDFPDALSNLGAMLQGKGDLAEAENLLRRAIRLNPRFTDARVNLGMTLALSNRGREAKKYFAKVLRTDPCNVDALFGTAFVAKTEGHFDQATAQFNRVLEISPKMPGALASLAGMRKMTLDNQGWLDRATALADSGIPPLEEAELRFAIGKYFDDVQNFTSAFNSYRQGNELLKSIADVYDRDARAGFVDEQLRIYSRESLRSSQAVGSQSEVPVFVIGMPRSGTSLVEQIISSHKQAEGAGELQFWTEVLREHHAVIHSGPLSAPITNKLANGYLETLKTISSDAQRIVDKAPINSDHVGLIYSVFPKAKFLYMQRDPIDTCLSCYFQKFPLSQTYTMDLSDLAHYYRQHQRLMDHWRRVLPAGSMLDVPYADLVANQQAWTRKILDFLNLEWDERCMNFYETERGVVTSSFWQVRQKLYSNSIQRWRHYENQIEPLLRLKDTKLRT